MKKAMFIKKIILFIALISFILSCNNSQNSNHNINANNERYSDIIFEEIDIEEIEIEEIIINEIEIEEIKIEEIEIEEIIIEEIEILENTIDENVILESAIAEVSTIEELERNIKNKEYSDDFWQDIDWAPVITKFAVGTSVIIITAVLSVATIDTPLHVVFLSSFKGAVKGAAIGAPSGAAINSVVQIALNGGKIDGWQKYAIEGAAEGFMWSTITGAIEGGIKGYETFKNRRIVDSNGAKYTKDEFGRIIEVKLKEVKPIKGIRNNYAQLKAGGVDRLPDDEGGHLIANMFGGSGKSHNLVAMSKDINRGQYYRIEQEIRKALEDDKKVTDLIIRIKYIGNSLRPRSFSVSYKIDGRLQTPKVIFQ